MTSPAITPEIRLLKEKKLVGKRLTMSFADYKIAALWQSFMPLRGQITNALSNDLISMAIYKPGHFTNFKPTNEFERWATVEVSDFDKVPAGMETFVLPEGQYAVFHYKGLNTDNSIFRYIFSEWLPASGYEADNRPHFEVLGKKYKNNHPDSEEDIWIPVRTKGA